MQSFSMSVPITLGNIAGSASDGVLIGELTAAAASAAILKSANVAGLCYTDDGGLYTNETTPFGEATGDDVEVLPATPADDDAAYFGHGTAKFSSVSMNQTTQGDGTWTITWQYWDGDSWEALAGVTDGTTGFTAATGWVDVTFTVPSDWATCTVDSVLGYWIRANVSGYSAVTTAPQVGQGYVTLVTAEYADETTDFNDAGAGDVALLPLHPAVGDAIYIGHAERFCKVKLTTSQAWVGTATLTAKYWDGDSWEAITVIDDDSVGYSATAGTHLIHFAPPSDWTANTAGNGPDGNAGFFIALELTAFTSMTTQPLLTQGWVYPNTTGASGIKSPSTGSSLTLSMDAQTASGSAADSVFVLINATRGTCCDFTWTKATNSDSDTATMTINANDELALVQVTEDGTTEFADVNFNLMY